MERLKFDEKSLKKAIEILKSGGVVIFPTETVYGIGALADKEEAIKRIFKIKNRPEDKPLQILIANLEQAKDLAQEIKGKSEELAKKYWPGPLTLVLKKKSSVSDLITASKETVGLRMPAQDWLLKLISKVGPLAASSANLSGETDPSSALEVTIEADLLLDGGKCKLGQASTVVDVSVDPPLILREGRIHPF
jgi:L-threonylcarbamoyladenylate synthase